MTQQQILERTHELLAESRSVIDEAQAGLEGEAGVLVTLRMGKAIVKLSKTIRQLSHLVDEALEVAESDGSEQGEQECLNQIESDRRDPVAAWETEP